MSAVDDLFKRLKTANEKAFMPFVTAGDPDLAFTEAVIRELDNCGCSMCEIGIPYSDPIADGPVIQASYTRALDRKIKVADIMQAVNRLSGDVAFPMVSMVSYAIVFRHGLEEYVVRAKDAGFAGAIVPDLLTEEAGPFSDICAKHDFSLIQLITPTTSQERAIRIAETTSGFIYYVSVTGITGERTKLPAELSDQVSWLREQTELPICIGFGISSPEHVKVLSPIADGLIVGSAIVKRMAECESNGREKTLAEVRAFAESILAELNR